MTETVFIFCNISLTFGCPLLLISADQSRLYNLLGSHRSQLPALHCKGEMEMNYIAANSLQCKGGDGASRHSISTLCPATCMRVCACVHACARVWCTCVWYTCARMCVVSVLARVLYDAEIPAISAFTIPLLLSCCLSQSVQSAPFPARSGQLPSSGVFV